MANARRRFWGLGLTIVAAVGIGLAFFWFASGPAYQPPPLTFDGDSTQLQRTIIVPTLDTPIPEGKSAIWCASFQLAWNKLKTDVAKGPVRIKNAEVVADRLNRAEQSAADLTPDMYYAAAGLVKDNIIETIQREMGKRFPAVTRPTFDALSGGAVAYGYLETTAKYTQPYFDNDKAFIFQDVGGKETTVRSFGLREKDMYAYAALRRQVRVLFTGRAMNEDGAVEEFALDLCRDSQPHQVAVARIKRPDSLADALIYVGQRSKGQQPDERSVRSGDTLLVPNMCWRVEHHFQELEGADKVLMDPPLTGLHIDTALQVVRFQMDRSGAELTSEAKIVVKAEGVGYRCNRPFLVHMQKRGAPHPFFVMWVDNAELLSKW